MRTTCRTCVWVFIWFWRTARQCWRARLIPDLVDQTGRMNSRMFLNGVRFFALPRVRRQLEAEIRAQFSEFARTGLTLDHVNVHKHFHLHPTLLEMLLRIGSEYGRIGCPGAGRAFVVCGAQRPRVRNRERGSARAVDSSHEAPGTRGEHAVQRPHFRRRSERRDG